MSKKYTKETLIPEEFIYPPIRDNTLIFFSHFGRYYYASKVLDIRSEDTIIDCSCGCGYGTFSLAQKAKFTFGLDINEDYLSLAQNNYQTDNILFTTYNDFYNYYYNTKVNKIISIETYEHIPKDEVIDFYTKLISKLKLDGSMFITVPLGNNEPSTYNPYHLNEPDIQHIYTLFSPHFKSINIEIDSFVNSFNQECQYCYLILKNKI